MTTGKLLSIAAALVLITILAMVSIIRSPQAQEGSEAQIAPGSEDHSTATERSIQTEAPSRPAEVEAKPQTNQAKMPLLAKEAPLSASIRDVRMSVSNGTERILYRTPVIHNFTYVSFAFVIETFTRLKRTKKPCITVYWLIEKQDTSRVRSWGHDLGNSQNFIAYRDISAWNLDYMPDLMRAAQLRPKYEQAFAEACLGGASRSAQEFASETFVQIWGNTGFLPYSAGLNTKVLIGRLEVWHDGVLLASWESITPEERERLTIASDWYLRHE